MNKIETDADVLSWAETVMAANGEKFTVLSKGDQLAIARFIVNNTVDRPATPPETQPQEDKAETPPSTPNVPQVERDEEPKTEPWEDKPIKGTTTTATVTRGYAYHRSGCTAQEAYDKFLTWGKDHPKDTSVMDFATGNKSSAAAFAYWLHELIKVEVGSAEAFIQWH